MRFGNVELAVGMRVGLVRRHRDWHTILFHDFGTVEKINGHGHIYVKHDSGKITIFNKHGELYKDDYGPHITNPDSLVSELAQITKDKEIRKLSDNLKETIQKHTSYGGKFHLTNNVLNDLKAHIAAMESMLQT